MDKKTDKQRDLFGNEYDLSDVLKKGPVQNLKNHLKYRKSESKEKRCKTCLFCYSKQYSKKYYKCEKIGNSNGPATDIALSYICDLWKKYSDVV